MEYIIGGKKYVSIPFICSVSENVEKVIKQRLSTKLATTVNIFSPKFDQRLKGGIRQNRMQSLSRDEFKLNLKVVKVKVVGKNL